MRYEGSCHCGRIAFTVEGDLAGAAACNCSLCRRKGALNWFVPRAALELTTPESALSTYLFNKEKIRHCFCDRCGIHPFAEGVDRGGNAMASVNVRCLDGVDLDALAIRQFDGARL